MSQRIFKRTCLDCFARFESKSRLEISADFFKHLDATGHNRQRIEDGNNVRLVQ